MECPTCGKVLPTAAGARQHHAKVHGESLPNRTCKGCGTAFYDPKSQRAFCDDCDPNAGPNNPNWRDAWEMAECRLCGSAFGYYPSDKVGVYCPECVESSEEFLGEPYVKPAEWVARTCEECGEEMSVLRSEIERGRGRFCSHSCLSMSMMEDNDHVDYNRGWWRLRDRALSRDDHACRLCGVSRDDIGREPDVHHIIPVRKFEDPVEAHYIENVVTLSRSCHVQVENGNLALPEHVVSGAELESQND